MRWKRGGISPDVIDRRGSRGGGGMGLLSILPLLLRSPFGWLIAIVVGAVYLFSGGVSFDRARQGSGDRPSSGAPAEDTRSEAVQFVSFVLDDAQQVWRAKFTDMGRQYENAKLVLFTDATQSGCGYGSSETGPFYCPRDERVYIDLGFYRELAQRFGAPGDFAQAYVIAHEIGHHVQNLLGTSDRVHGASSREQGGAEGLSVRLELQADCYAGVWGHSTNRRDILERGDIDEGLTAASAIGDDRLQRQGTGRVNPESWTHGSSEQRARWFRRGLESGNPAECDTFAVGIL